MIITLNHHSYWHIRPDLRSARWTTRGWGGQDPHGGVAGGNSSHGRDGIGRDIDGEKQLEGGKALGR